MFHDIDCWDFLSCLCKHMKASGCYVLASCNFTVLYSDNDLNGFVFSYFVISFYLCVFCSSACPLSLTSEKVFEGPVADGGSSPVPNLTSIPEPPVASVGCQGPGDRKAHWQVQLHLVCVHVCVSEQRDTEAVCDWQSKLSHFVFTKTQCNLMYYS